MKVLHAMISKAIAARKVLTPCMTFGFNSMKTVDAYDQQANWLKQQDPPVDNPFPVDLQKQIFSTRAAHAWPAVKCWQSMSPSTAVAFMTDEDIYLYI